MTSVTPAAQRGALLDRREKLRSAAAATAPDAEITRLLGEVDAALERTRAGTYGLCEACQGAIEPERLLADPLVSRCLDHPTPGQQRALGEDLELAALIQRNLLPRRGRDTGTWQIDYHYEPAGPVSGDYCDWLTTDDGDLYFMLGDVSGKGVAAALLMSNLQAMFRALVPTGLTLDKLMARASRLFCENTLSTHFATLVCGRAAPTGEVEVCNAGHLPPLVLRGGTARALDATGLPVGVFCDEHFLTTRVQLEPGDALLLYTDGVTEAEDGAGEMYGVERLVRAAGTSAVSAPGDLVRRCVDAVTAFRGAGALTDDLTVMAIRRAP